MAETEIASLELDRPKDSQFFSSPPLPSSTNYLGLQSPRTRIDLRQSSIKGNIRNARAPPFLYVSAQSNAHFRNEAAFVLGNILTREKNAKRGGEKHKRYTEKTNRNLHPQGPQRASSRPIAGFWLSRVCGLEIRRPFRPICEFSPWIVLGSGNSQI